MNRAMRSNPDHKIEDQATDKDQELQQAEQRAEQAEQELHTRRRTVEELKSERQPNSPPESDQSRTAPRKASHEPAQNSHVAGDAIQQLRQEPMMAHLLDALEDGQDIGHYGRLVFAMVAHHFLSQQEMVAWLTKDQDFSEEAAVVMLRQVQARDYNPPRRERILGWQREQEFPIIPNAEDPDCGNVYRNLKFPQHVYEDIQDYQEKKAETPPNHQPHQ